MKLYKVKFVDENEVYVLADNVLSALTIVEMKKCNKYEVSKIELVIREVIY